MKIVSVKISVCVRSSLRSIVSMSVFIVMVKSIGNRPCKTSTSHYSVASVRSARGRTLKNFHSARSRSLIFTHSLARLGACFVVVADRERMDLDVCVLAQLLGPRLQHVVA